MWIKTVVNDEESCINLSQYRAVRLQFVDQVWGGDNIGKGGRKVRIGRIWADGVLIYSSTKPNEAQEMFDRIKKALAAEEIL